MSFLKKIIFIPIKKREYLNNENELYGIVTFLKSKNVERREIQNSAKDVSS